MRLEVLVGYLLPLIAVTNAIVEQIIRSYKKQALPLREDKYLGNLPILEEYDFIVVGASPAGCVVANRLSEDPNLTVLLLEAGSEENAYTDVPQFSIYLIATQYNWNFRSLYNEGVCRAMESGVCPWPSGRGIGGGTVMNGMIFTRGNRRDFDRWAEAGNTGWGFDDVLQYFNKAENMSIGELRGSPFHGTEGPVNVDYQAFYTPLSEIFIRAGQERGYPKTDYNAPYTHTGFSRIQSSTRFGKRMSASKAYLYPIRNRPNLHIVQRAYVTKVIIDPIVKRATGVNFLKMGIKRKVMARAEVIVSAGAFQSPKLLMLSGIGPQDHLAYLNIPLIQNLPVGYNLQEHIGTSALTFTLEKPYVLNLTESVWSLPQSIIDIDLKGSSSLSTVGCDALGYIKTKYALPGDNPDLELILILASYSSDLGNLLRKTVGVRDDVYNAVYKELEFKYTGSVWVMGMYPESRGRVSLASSDPTHPPLINNNFLDDPQDLRVVIEGIKEFIKILETDAMKSVGAKLHKKPLPGCKTLTFGTDEYWECYVREITAQYHHQCGTCKMGPIDDGTAVVDPRLRVHGITGLRVADASIMPTITGGHTMAPSYMIGEKAADLIKQDYYSATFSPRTYLDYF